MQKPSRTIYKRKVKEKVKEIRKYNKEHNIQSNRIRSAAFYVQYNPMTEQPEYIMKADRVGEKFESRVPFDGERDKQVEILSIYNVLTTEWKWQEPDCMAYVNLIYKQLTTNGK